MSRIFGSLQRFTVLLYSNLSTLRNRTIKLWRTSHQQVVPCCSMYMCKYEVPFKTKCHQCFRNLYRTSNIHIGRPIYTYIRRPIYICDVRYLYPMSDIPALTLAIAIALALAEVRYCISDVQYIYATSNIYIRRPISLP